MPIRDFLKDSHGFDDEAIRVMGLALVCARSTLRISIDDPTTEIVADAGVRALRVSRVARVKLGLL